MNRARRSQSKNKTTWNKASITDESTGKVSNFILSPLHPPNPSFQMWVSRGYTNTRLFFEGGKGGTRPLTET